MKLKRILFSMIICFTAFSAFPMANPPKPLWMTNLFDVYPKKQFLAEIGYGAEIDDAKAAAIANIARQFNVSVKNSVSASLNAIETNGELNETRQIINNIDMTSSVDLFAVQYSETYYSKSDKKYYIVAFIDREEGFVQYEPVLKQKYNAFYNFYNSARKKTGNFEKYLALKDAMDNSLELLESLSFARMLNTAREEKYENARNDIASIPAIMKECARKSSIFISVEGDYGNILQQGISEIFTKIGLNVVKSKKSDILIARVTVDDCLVKNDDIFAVFPLVTVNLLDGNGNSLFSYSYKAQKYAAYSLEKAKQRCFQEVIVTIQNEISSELFGAKLDK